MAGAVSSAKRMKGRRRAPDQATAINQPSFAVTIARSFWSFFEPIIKK
jgi:hypothetical protein